MHSVPFQNNRSRAREILESVHTDLNGPHKNTGFDGSIRSSHKFVPTFVYTFHVSIYKHTAIGDQCT